ncbi:MAG: hypothetical protein IRZ16_17355 [Myxococcaceae bacterium]|nr:hypothetical protein [Myxococcaceae bacterium]
MCAGVIVAGCRTVSTPESTAQAYARALEEGRLHDAYALTSTSQRTSGLTEAMFAKLYRKPDARRARATAVKVAASSLTARSGTVALVREAEGWRVVEPLADFGPKKTLEAFVAAAEAGDFAAAYRLLAAPLRARYTPERLEADFRAEPLARERLARARQALAQQPVLEGGTARFPIGEGRAVTLTLEADGYRVAAIE